MLIDTGQNLLHFLYLRMDAHAQYEIRRYAEIMGQEIVAKWCPAVWEAFMDYRVNSNSFTRLEMEVLTAMTQGDKDKAVALGKSFNWLSDAGEPKKNRERAEFEDKLEGLGLKAPW